MATSTKRLGARTLFLLGAALFAFGTAGCQATEVEDADSSEDTFSVPTSPSAGEARDITLTDVPARSRIASERRQGLADKVIATWHVHYVSTTEGFRGNVVYGVDKTGSVRLMLVMAADARSLVIIEPDDTAPSEGSLADVARNPHAPISPALLEWVRDELLRLGEVGAKKSAGGVTTRAFTGLCAARVSTMLLTVVAGIVLGPVGGFVASAVEAAAWGDFGGAAVVGGLGAGYATTEAMKKSSTALIRTTGSALKGAGVVGLVGLVGAGIFLSPKEALASLIPPQCKDATSTGGGW